MHNLLRKDLTSAKKLTNTALIFLGLPLLPFLAMFLFVLFFSNFDFIGVLSDFWISTHISYPLFLCVYGAPLLAFSHHLKKCLRKGKSPSIKKILFLRAFFLITLLAGCCMNVNLLFLYSSVGINTFSLFVAFVLLTSIIGSIFALSAFFKARKIFA